MIDIKLVDKIVRRKYPKYQKKEIMVSDENGHILVQIDDNVYEWRNNVLIPTMK